MKFTRLLIIFILLETKVYSQIHFKNCEETVNYALKNAQNYSLNLLYSQTALKAAKLAISDFIPTLDFSFSEDDSVALNSTDSKNKSISLNVNYKVFDGGKKLITYRMNKAEKFFQVKSSEINIDNFRSSVINQYYKCLLQNILINIKDELEKTTKFQLDIIEKEFQLGLSLENTYLEYLISYKKILDEKRQAEREKRSQYRILKILLGMSPETDMILDNEELDIIDYEIYLEPYTEVLWNLVKKNNPSIKKNEIAMYYQKQQYQYNQRFFVPELTFQGGISFSGSDYPLNGPKYSAKVMINFSNIPFMPSSVQNSYGLSNNGLKSINNSISSSFTVTPDYFYNKRLTTVQLQQTQQSYTDEMNKMYETFFNQIATYDDLLDSIYRLTETINLEKRRISISEKQVEKGEMKRIDLLKELIELSEQKIQLEQTKMNISSTCRTLEIMLCVPFGGLERCIKN